MTPDKIEQITGLRVIDGAASVDRERPAWLDEALAADDVLLEAWRGAEPKGEAAQDRVVIQRLLSRSDEDIMGALRWRPSRFFRPPTEEKLVEELARCRRMLREEREHAQRSVVVERLVIYDGDPPSYDATVRVRGGTQTVKLTPAQLLSAAQFKRRVMELCHDIVAVPRKQAEWEELVRGWLEAAERVSVGSTGDEFVDQEIDAIVSNWPIIDIADAVESDLRRGSVIDDEERALRIVHMAPVRQELRARGLEHDPNQLAIALRKLGWTNDRVYIGGKQVRAWTRPREDT